MGSGNSDRSFMALATCKGAEVSQNLYPATISPNPSGESYILSIWTHPIYNLWL